MTARYTGTMRKGDEPGTVVAEIKDKWGWVISLTGTRQPDSSYALTGTLGDVPPTLRIPAVDGAASG